MYQLNNTSLKKAVITAAAGLSALSFLLLTTCGGQRMNGAQLGACRVGVEIRQRIDQQPGIASGVGITTGRAASGIALTCRRSRNNWPNPTAPQSHGCPA